MTVRIVRLGTPRTEDEGLRIGTVRHPPRGVPKSQYASQNWYDVWFPNLAPSAELLKLGRAARTEGEWKSFLRKFKAEMSDAGQEQDPRPARCSVTPDQLLRRLLLRRRAALPPIDTPGLAAGAGRSGRMKTSWVGSATRCSQRVALVLEASGFVPSHG